jgi:DNA-binding response OmpR family regulator
MIRTGLFVCLFLSLFLQSANAFAGSFYCLQYPVCCLLRGAGERGQVFSIGDANPFRFCSWSLCLCIFICVVVFIIRFIKNRVEKHNSNEKVGFHKVDFRKERLRLSKQTIYCYLKSKLSAFRTLARQKGIEVHLKLDSGSLDGCLGYAEMDKIIDDLLSNAIHYTEKGSLSIVLTYNKNKWYIEINDTEAGMPSKNLPERETECRFLPEKELLLLTENDPDMLRFLTERLSNEYRVVSSMDGAQTLEKARELNPDIIISDILIPTLRGDAMCRILKSSVETSHIPVILLTALNEKEDIIQGLESGADDYITKPFDFTILRARIRNILQNREKLRKLILSAETAPEDFNYSNQLDKDFLDKAIRIIEKELSNPGFSVNEFCRELGMSRTSAYNKIKTLTNQGPNDFIRIIRLNRAKNLLLLKKYSISEVADMVGFSDSKYFSTSFKKQFGLSPSKVEH